MTLSVDCSAGFYVRSLAHDLGERLGVGAHLAALRRTRSGDFGLDRAIALDAAERDPRRAAAALVPLAGMLPDLPAVVLTADGVDRAVARPRHRARRPVERASLSPSSPQPSALSPSSGCSIQRGDLVAIAEPTRRRRFCIPPLFWCNMLILLD